MITEFKGDEVERLVVLPMIHSQEPLSKGDSANFINCTLMEKEKTDVTKLLKKIDSVTHMRKILVTRQTHSLYKFTASDYLSIFLVMMDNMSPGILVMYMACMQYYVHIHHKENSVFTMDDFAMLFPMGVPSDEKLSEIWDSQKCHIEFDMNDNCVDHTECYKSIS